MPDTSPTPVHLRTIENYAIEAAAHDDDCPTLAHCRTDVLDLIAELRSTRAASSERIRELEAENARLRQHANAIPPADSGRFTLSTTTRSALDAMRTAQGAPRQRDPQFPEAKPMTDPEQVIADAWHNCENDSCSMDVDGCAYRREAVEVGTEAVAALRAASFAVMHVTPPEERGPRTPDDPAVLARRIGLRVAGPDEIVVSRDVVLQAVAFIEDSDSLGLRRPAVYDALLAALSQPHPAQEQP